MNNRIWTASLVILSSYLFVNASSLLGLRYPLGVPLSSTSGMTAGMGGAITGTPSENNVMLGNPANLGGISKAVFSTYVTLDYLRLSNTETKAATNMSGFTPQQMSFGFPLGVAGTIGLGFERSSDLSSRLSYTQRITDIPTITSASLDQARVGSLTSWRGGWGYRIGKWVDIGLLYQRLYLAERTINQVTTSGLLTEVTSDFTKISASANGIGGGLMTTIDRASLGLVGTYVFTGTGKADRLIDGNGIELGSSSSSFSLKLPPTLSLGGSYQFSPEWLGAADLKSTLWSKYSSEGFLSSAALRSTALSFALGGQYIPSPTLLLPRYWETIQYRAGLHLAQMPIADAAEWGLSLGAGLPLPSGGAVVDFVLEYARRTDKKFTAYNEQIVKIGFGITGGRKWAKPTQSTY